MNNKIVDYYTHTIPKGKTVKLSNNITNTLIILSKDRNKFIYKNPYNFVVNLENPYYDVIEIELVRLYFNYCKPLINNDNNTFEFFYTINNEDYIFNMSVGEFNPSNNEHNYVIEFNSIFYQEGVQNIHYIIDTSRNGGEKERKDCSNWCNIRYAGVGIFLSLHRKQ